MRIDRIVLKGFMSYPALDWSPNGARLVCLTGPNGAGKSALASEALAYALFDAARLRADDLVRTGATEMAVTVEMAFAGARYRVTRGRTTRSGGKSFLELAIGSTDGQTWMPLTGDDIRATQAAIAALLHLDAGTFGSVVLLAQGDHDRFTAATPGERKRVLGQVLGLDRFERAEAAAREMARDLEAAVAAERARLERLADAIGELADVDERLAHADEALAGHASASKDATARREAAEARMRDLATSLAAIDAAEADVRRIDAELAEHKARWRRASDARDLATMARQRATAALERSADVETATAALPEARARVETLERDEGHVVALRQQLADAEARLREVEEAHAAAVRDHATHRARMTDRVVALEEQQAHLGNVTCPKCSHAFAADPGDVAGRLAAAKAELDQVGAPPEPPLRIARERAQVARRQIALEQATVDPAGLAAARQELLGLERTAALAGEIAAQRQALADAEVHIANALADLAFIEKAGKHARAALTKAQARVDEGAAVRAQRDEAQAELTTATRALEDLELTGRTLTERRARTQAQQEHRDALRLERAEVEAAIAKADVAIARERKLVRAFGRDGIPARIIDSVLPELTDHINDVLASLRPGFSLEMRTQRAKKSGDGVVEALDLIVRSDSGEHPFAAYSGGERTSLNLAIAVGLSRLVARRAGTAIRTLLVDEPDGLDAESRRALGHALKVLAHRGDLERIVVVTHTPDLAEFGDAVYQVTKDGAGSVVELAA